MSFTYLTSFMLLGMDYSIQNITQTTFVKAETLSDDPYSKPNLLTMWTGSSFISTRFGTARE